MLFVNSNLSKPILKFSKKSGTPEERAILSIYCHEGRFSLPDRPRVF